LASPEPAPPRRTRLPRAAAARARAPAAARLARLLGRRGTDHGRRRAPRLPAVAEPHRRRRVEGPVLGASTVVVGGIRGGGDAMGGDADRGRSGGETGCMSPPRDWPTKARRFDNLSEGASAFSASGHRPRPPASMCPAYQVDRSACRRRVSRTRGQSRGRSNIFSSQDHRVSSPHEQREQDEDRANHEKCIDPITHIQQYQAIRAINACSVNEETSNGPTR
jgi:hypothetical protein